MMRNDCEHQVFSSELNERLFMHRTPLSGGIELTNRCNFRCVHCYETVERDSQKEVLSTERLIQIIDELISMGMISVFLTGGEAMLRPDFDYVYKYLREHGVLTSILSNGSTVTEEKCALFRQYMPRMIDVSIYGATEETYAKVTGRMDMFKKVMSGLGLLKKYNIPFQLKTVLLSVNKYELDAMREIAKQFGVPFKFFTSIRPYNDGNRNPIDYMLTADEIIQLEKEDAAIIEYYKDKAIKRVYSELAERQKNQCTYLCRIARNSFFISFDGILNGCVRSRRSGFDLKTHSLAEGWSYLYQTFVEPKKSKPFSCAKCKIMNYCDFCPGEFEIETGDPTVPPEAICELAHQRFDTFGKNCIIS